MVAVNEITVTVILPIDVAKKMIGPWYLVKKDMSDTVRIAMAKAVDEAMDNSDV